MGRILKKRSVMILLALMLIMGLAPMNASAEPQPTAAGSTAREAM